MRLLIVSALLVLAGCTRDRVACTIPDGQQQATSQNDRARRAQYGPSYTDPQFDSMAVANCWTVTR